MVKFFSAAFIISLTASCTKIETSKTVTALVEQQVSSVVSCDPAAKMTLYCGFKNPEDIVIVPGGEKLLVSEMGEFMIHPPGELVLLDLASGERETIKISWQSVEKWGDVNCPIPDIKLFSPHGIDLMQREDGLQQLLVVNHGGREAVEFFELSKELDVWSLQWRGCALPPGDPFINDVVSLNDGGFLVTHMWDKSLPFEKVVGKWRRGEKTGWVYEWQAKTGFVKVPNSMGMMPNGIAVSADNSKIFVNIYVANKTLRIDRASGHVDGAFNVQQPDNITVDESGMLWIASQKGNPIKTCIYQGVCLLPFEIIRADPETLETEVILSHDGRPMGYVTVAIKVGSKVYMGSAHGDRIASYPISNRIP